MAATTGTSGRERASTRRMPSTGSIAQSVAPRRWGRSSRVNLPVPAARSQIRAPARIGNAAASQATASGGYDGRARS